MQPVCAPFLAVSARSAARSSAAKAVAAETGVRQQGRSGSQIAFLPGGLKAGRDLFRIGDGALHGNEADILNAQERQQELEVRLNEVGCGKGLAVKIAFGPIGGNHHRAPGFCKSQKAVAVKRKCVPDTNDLVDPGLEGRGDCEIVDRRGNQQGVGFLLKVK